MVSDPAYTTASSSVNNAGTTRWMSPERLSPTEFGSKDSRPTTASDCYALGMVILEVLSGRVPYHQFQNTTVILMVMRGVRPGRPGRSWFTDDLWRTMEKCWSPRPSERPTIEAIFELLGQLAATWRPLPPDQEDDDGIVGDETVPTVSHYQVFRYFIVNLVLRLSCRFDPVELPWTWPQQHNTLMSNTTDEWYDHEPIPPIFLSVPFLPHRTSLLQLYTGGYSYSSMFSSLTGYLWTLSFQPSMRDQLLYWFSEELDARSTYHECVDG